MKLSARSIITHGYERGIPLDFVMADILTFKKRTPAEKHKGRSLCRSGFHKWEIVTEKKFDVKQGRLVTQYKCKRCGKQKVTAL